MRKHSKHTIIAFIILILAISIYYPGLSSNIMNIPEGHNLDTNLISISRDDLEPEKPVTIEDPPFEHPLPSPSKVLPISTILEKNQQIPFNFAYKDIKWQRAAYYYYWHSSYMGGRWSYVPFRLHYALHSIFATYPSAALYWDFIHNVGIKDESPSFNLDESLNNPFKYIAVVVMHSNVQKVVTYGNQVVLVAEPQRAGLQVITIPTDKIKPFDINENILLQLVTSEGNEIDYTINYPIKH